ncbi:MAG: non-canonical purine NTP pyrophosphatase [Candidatus Melainabacteria bacterium]|nr:non-canonical purine NTP pyrophosphatase [Candidatus Melainabacteria bacterium]
MKKSKYIYFASSNKDKLNEIKNIWPLKKISIKPTPRDFLVNENGKSFVENAYKKAKSLSKKLKCIAFSDDSGIEVFVLNKKPGVKSSRFFRNGKGMYEIIQKLKNKKNKKCCFTCAIVATDMNGKIIFKTKKSWFGRIAEKPIGENGFGYDPIFIVPGLNKTSAQISPNLKNKLSHRAMAVKAFAKWLQRAYKSN